MSMNSKLLEAVLAAGKGEGLSKSGLAVPGDASTYVVMLSMAQAREGRTEDAEDRRLR